MHSRVQELVITFNDWRRCASTRMVAGFWWLFTLIMVSSYTANLATFLIVQDLDVSIRSATDLPGQDKVKYGCLGSGTTFTFFKVSTLILIALPAYMCVLNHWTPGCTDVTI